MYLLQLTFWLYRRDILTDSKEKETKPMHIKNNSTKIFNIAWKMSKIERHNLRKGLKI